VGGEVALYAADTITVGPGAGIATSGGSVRMIAGTTPNDATGGINSSHAGTFGGNSPQVATETGDDTGAIWLRAPVSVDAGNIVLISAANAPGITDTGGIIVSGGVLQPGSTGIAQDANGALIGTGILTAVALRGAGGPNLGGAPVSLNQASTTMNSIADVNLFACAFIGCPGPQIGSGIAVADWAPFKTAPFLRN